MFVCIMKSEPRVFRGEKYPTNICSAQADDCFKRYRLNESTGDESAWSDLEIDFNAFILLVCLASASVQMAIPRKMWAEFLDSLSRPLMPTDFASVEFPSVEQSINRKTFLSRGACTMKGSMGFNWDRKYTRANLVHNKRLFRDVCLLKAGGR